MAPRSNDQNDREESGSGISPRLVAGGALLVVLLVFTFENTKKTTIRFLVPEVKTPLSVALLIAVVLGFVAGALFGRSRRKG